MTCLVNIRFYIACQEKNAFFIRFASGTSPPGSGREGGRRGDRWSSGAEMRILFDRARRHPRVRARTAPSVKVGNPELRHAALTRAEEVAGSAQLEVHLRDPEAVGRPTMVASRRSAARCCCHRVGIVAAHGGGGAHAAPPSARSAGGSTTVRSPAPRVRGADGAARVRTVRRSR